MSLQEEHHFGNSIARRILTGSVLRASLTSLLGSEALKNALGVFIASRLPIFLVASVFVGFVPVAADRLPSFLDAFYLWDGAWYLSVAEGGYRWSGSFLEPSNLAFLPLYPFLGKIVGTVFAGNIKLGLFLVSNLSFALYLYLLYKLGCFDFGEDTALRAITYVGLFPTALFFSTLYSEATLLALVTGAFYFGRTGRWKGAVLMGTLASVTRLAGVIVVFPLLYEYIRQKGLRPSVLSLFLVPASIAAYAGYVWQVTGEPMGLVRFQEAWHRVPTLQWDTARLALEAIYRPMPPYAHTILVLDTVTFFAFMALTALVIWRLPRAYAVYSVPAFLFATSTTSVGFPTAGLSRFLLAVFPCFILMSMAGKNQLVHRCLLSTSTVLMGILTIYYFGAFWVE